MAETSMPKINEITTMQDRVRQLSESSPLRLTHVRRQQEEVASFLLTHAPWLLDLALTAASAEQCDRCKGHGRWWVITDVDSGYWERCPKCTGSGLAAASGSREAGEQG